MLLQLLILGSLFQAAELDHKMQWNTLYSFTTDEEKLISILRYTVDKSIRVFRVTLESNESSVDNLLLVSLRQRNSIISLQIPRIINNYQYDRVSRTLCPLQDVTNSEPFTIAVGSYQPLNYTVRTDIVTDFEIKTNETRAITASASQPKFFHYVFPEDIDSVTVHVDSNSTICMTVSIQEVGCLVFDLQSNVRYKGLHSTVATHGTVRVSKSKYKEFYVVFVINENDDLCEDWVNIKPMKPMIVPLVEKAFTVTIEEKLKPTYLGIIFTTIVMNLSLLVIIVVVLFSFKSTTGSTDVKSSSPTRSTDVESSSTTGPTTGNITTETSHLLLQKSKAGEKNQAFQATETLPSTETRTPQQDIEMQQMGNEQTDTTNQVRSSPEDMDGNIITFLKKYDNDALIMSLVSLGVSLAISQIMYNQAENLEETGNSDKCVFNFNCAHPFWIFPAANNVFSNVPYFFVGVIVFVVNCFESHDEGRGVYKHYGIRRAIGVAIAAEGIFSGAFHVCPSRDNFHIDTFNMYLIAFLSIKQTWSNRHEKPFPIVHIFLYCCLVTVVGALDMRKVYFTKYFFFLLHFGYLSFLLYVFCCQGSFAYAPLEIRNTEGFWSRLLKRLRNFFRKYGCWARFILAALVFVSNLLIFFFLSNEDLFTRELYMLIINTILYQGYYLIMKIIYEKDFWTAKRFVLVIAVAATWILAFICFTSAVSDWKTTPAHSQEINQDCWWLLGGFYDSHDAWHYLSALALFLTSVLLNTMDDNVADIPRNQLPCK